MALFGHECDRFMVSGFRECPFRRRDEHEDDEDDDFDDAMEFRLAFPVKRNADQVEGRSPLTIAHLQPKMREALERMAAIKDVGGLPSIPRFDPTIPEFPFGGRGHQEAAAILAALAAMQGLRLLRQTGSRPSLQAVQHSEKRAARGLSKVLGTSRTRGRGGLHVNEAANLRRLLFGRRKLLNGTSLIAGFDSFSETGFP